MKVTVKINKQEIENRFHTKFQQAQKKLDEEVLKDSDPFVPMDTGNLRNSGMRGTTLGSGQVIYNAPYARKCYYGTKTHFSTARHPQATAQWFEKSKALNVQKWTGNVQKTVTGTHSTAEKGNLTEPPSVYLDTAHEVVKDVKKFAKVLWNLDKKQGKKQ